jgi:hypothetical protein
MSTHEPDLGWKWPDDDSLTIQVLCGCGWGNLAMAPVEVDFLTQCPQCGRGFDSETGWEAS